MADDLPYRAEYAKSGRAGCKGCKTPIQKDTLRLAVMVQSPMFDGKTPHWYHFSCFFGKQRPRTVGDIAHFDALRYNDQEKIKQKMESLGSGVAAVPTTSGKGKGKKRAASEPNGLKDFVIEYSKSSRAMCRGCEEKVMKDDVRISKKDYESEHGRMYGGQDRWHHVECFAKLRDELQFWASGADIPGFKTLNKEDQQAVKKALPVVEPKAPKHEVDGVTPVKKIKVEPSDTSEDEEIKKQNKIMYKHRDNLKEQLKKKDLVELLQYNGQQVPVGPEKMLDRLADVMTFGIPLPCKECKGGQFVYRSGVGYQCIGDLTEWTKCQNKTLDPPRAPFKVPSHLREQYDFLNSYKYKERKRVIKIVAPSTMPASVMAQLPNLPVKSEPGMELKSTPKVYRPPAPLKNMEFVILGISGEEKDTLKREIQKLGGKVTSKIHPMVFAVISTQAEIDRMGSRMEQVKCLDIHVVADDFVNDVKDGEEALSVIKKKAISSWGGDPKARITQESEAQKSRIKSGSMFRSTASKVKLTIKGGIAVDPDSKLEDIAHVYQNGKTVYNAVLGLTDIQKGKNSYYKLQILQSDKGQKFWLFRSWGRIGTTCGGNKVEPKSTLYDAIEAFEELYREKTGNDWENRDKFVKRPGCMYPLDVHYGDEDKPKKLAEAQGGIKSKLAKPVQDLITTIFDVETMKKCMMEFELDLEKMPLGKLSRRQILQAYSVLKELLEYVQSEAKQDTKSVNAHAHLVDASNRFYTLIPHDFGTAMPPILNTEEIIQHKLDMLESLMDIEIAYNMLNTGEAGDDVHPIDAQYAKLLADIEVLDRSSKEFDMLQQYVKNTHAATHNQYELEIEEVFKVRRHKEERQFKPFKKLDRKLLWHGSRLTNYAGILSQGLRIAPPEAPCTGYMFGKGIYFADMVSKSANYCMTSKKNPVGYMLLCEVALGKMYERTQADYIEKLPKGMHSCKGVGRTQPDPSAAIKTEDGVEIPLGPAVTDDNLGTSLLYNEYIVYDVAQVKFQYLFKMKFTYKF